MNFILFFTEKCTFILQGFYENSYLIRRFPQISQCLKDTGLHNENFHFLRALFYEIVSQNIQSWLVWLLVSYEM
jgi:hypothetical protein